MRDEIKENEIFFKKRKIDKNKYKELILDETFKKAEFYIANRKKKKMETTKAKGKPFIKSGIAVIFIAIFAIICVQFFPWMYLKYDTATGGVEYFVGRDFFIQDQNIDKINPEIINLFEAPISNKEKYSGSYIGLTLNDFSNIPKTTMTAFVIMIIISIIFSLYLIIDKFHTFNIDNVTMIYSGFAACCIVLSLIVLIYGLKFIASYFMLYFNWQYVIDLGINDIRLVYVVPLIMIFLSLVLVKSCITILKLNYHDIEKRDETEKSEKRFLTFKFGAFNND